jgi:Flp pilus assembly protein TadG
MKLMARCRDLRDETGAAVVELALIVSIFFVPLILGTTDMAGLVYDSIEISSAAHAGAMAGMVNSAQAQDNSAITTAAQAEASDFVSNNVTVTPTVYYTCNTAQGGTQYSTQTAANLACTSPSYPIEFVQVTVSAPVALPFYCFGIPSSVTLKGESVMEVQGQQ